MKKLIRTYSFSASGKTVTFTGLASVRLDSILLITNVTRGKILYNFADPTATGSVVGNVLTLIADTTGMSDSDALQIWYDGTDQLAATDESIAATNALLAATNALLASTQDQNTLLRRMVKLTESLATVDANQRQRVALDGGLGSGISIPVFTKLGDSVNAQVYVPGTTSNGFPAMYTVQDGWKFLDACRLNFQECIRTKLTFS